MKQRDEYIVDFKIHNPKTVNLICDVLVSKAKKYSWGATFYGKRGLYKTFKDIPIQMCHFHQKKIVQRYITMRPKLEASKDLKKIVSRLTLTTEKNFTHPRNRAAYKSLQTNLPYLFTYKNYKNLSITNTTNALEGGVFSHIKKYD